MHCGPEDTEHGQDLSAQSTHGNAPEYTWNMCVAVFESDGLMFVFRPLFIFSWLLINGANAWVCTVV